MGEYSHTRDTDHSTGCHGFRVVLRWQRKLRLVRPQPTVSESTRTTLPGRSLGPAPRTSAREPRLMSQVQSRRHVETETSPILG